MRELKNKIIAITGAGSGIGRALALELDRIGAQLALNDYNEESLRQTSDMIISQNGKHPLCSAFDVAEKESFFSFAQHIINHYGAVDILINNAGIGMGKVPFHLAELDYFERVFDINFKGVLYGSSAFIPHLLKRHEAALVNVSSIFGLTGIANSEAYAASKFAVNGLTLSLMQTYRNTFLTVQCVYPGGIKTNIIANALDKPKDADMEFEDKFLKRSPESAASIIIKGIKSKKRRILIGGEANLLDIATRIAPILGCNLVNHQVGSKNKGIAQ